MSTTRRCGPTGLHDIGCVALCAFVGEDVNAHVTQWVRKCEAFTWYCWLVKRVKSLMLFSI